MASNLRSVSVSVMYGLPSVETVPKALSVISVISCVPLVASVSLRRRAPCDITPCHFTLLVMPVYSVTDAS